ncbi:hypothetical protein Osc7112_3963 [Oscillatoria nigro-viridis PCC 7112]|uniref:Uncharacterized protein n=1 Tax=Phormidium nigroviride PCC 7112 TaxID=179408 RepID=K9VM29_9CYAN|nr:hypothetical protein [Oscillatoria nigro-viridis]AFZ08300.1 hypothetical protein Osc7112_3963 [Oscillatoria nigro-viridis PCC 7112]
MATITPLRPNGVSPSSKLLVVEPKATPQLQSPEGRKIAELTDELLQNLTVVKQYLQTLESIGEIDWQPVPPKRSERVMMRAQFKGRKKPLPYIFDEE